MARGLQYYMSKSGEFMIWPEETMKNPYTKCTYRIALFFFFLLFNYFFLSSSSVGSPDTSPGIMAYGFDPGAILILGTVLIGFAAWGRKKFVK